MRSITLYIPVNLASEQIIELTMRALLLIVDKIQRAIESGHFSCGIFLDLRKALDTVDHDILLAKLYSYGIRGTPYDWFVSYLSNRSQFVSIAKVVVFS